MCVNQSYVVWWCINKDPIEFTIMESLIQSLMSNLDAVSAKLQDNEYKEMVDDLYRMWNMRDAGSTPVPIESNESIRSRVRDIMDGHGTSMDLFGVRRSVAPPRFSFSHSDDAALFEAALNDSDDIDGIATASLMDESNYTMTNPVPLSSVRAPFFGNPEELDLDAMEELVRQVSF